MTPRHIALALLVVLIWGVNFVVIHEGLEGVPPLLFAAIRFSCIVPFVAVVPRPKVAWRDLAPVGLLMSAGQFGFLYSAMAAGLASGMASLILQAQALFTVVFAAALLKERPKAIQLVGMGVALAGLVLVASGRSGATPLVGVMLCLAGALSWGAGNVAARRGAGASGLGLTVWGSLFVPLPLFALSFLIEGPNRMVEGLHHFGGAAVASTAYTVVLASLVGYTIWNGLMGHYRLRTSHRSLCSCRSSASSPGGCFSGRCRLSRRSPEERCFCSVLRSSSSAPGIWDERPAFRFRCDW
ncbi:EamA family transporter [Dermacoccus sp. PE3]|uniref:EamA family transporter n=1 Tax=Dermacoccus sp. PE3 TaxID=1641401 RepID=UPI000B0B5CA5|nr:EamA family transporter [Dermacoccus sp. PE3]